MVVSHQNSSAPRSTKEKRKRFPFPHLGVFFSCRYLGRSHVNQRERGLFEIVRVISARLRRRSRAIPTPRYGRKQLDDVISLIVTHGRQV